MRRVQRVEEHHDHRRPAEGLDRGGAVTGIRLPTAPAAAEQGERDCPEQTGAGARPV